MSNIIKKLKINNIIILIIAIINICQLNCQEASESSEIIKDSKIIENVSCLSEKDCNYYGKCIRSICYCDYGVVTVTSDINIELDEEKLKLYGSEIDASQSFGTKGCNYKQKYQINAFLLELFPGFGVGHFYARRIGDGIAKLLASIGLLFFVLIYPLLIRCCSKCGSFTVGLLFLISVILFIIYVIIDVAMFATNKFKDGNGIDLVPYGY